jgi:beta-N-acetylhexosaminidase
MRQITADIGNVEMAVIDDRSTEKEIKTAMDNARQADIILAPLYGRVRTGQARSVGLPEKGTQVLRGLLDENKSVIGISFGNPYLLSELPSLKTYLVAYGDMATLQRASARSVTGRQSITGRLPISLPGMHKIGTGIQINRQK